MEAEVQRPLSKDDVELVKLSRLFESMITTEAWKQYLNLVSIKSAEYMSKVLMDGSRDEDMKHKGALMGLSYCMGLPSATIRDAKDVLARAGRTSEED